jgi:translation initiation factor 4G
VFRNLTSPPIINLVSTRFITTQSCLMTSFPPKQPGLQPQGQSNTTPAASNTNASSASPLANTAARTYANATKKSTESDSAHHGKSPSISPPVNGRPPMQHNQSSGVTIVNGAPAGPQGDHSRKPSVTISSGGTTGYIPNGGPAGGAPSRTNSIQFGSMNQQGSPAMGSPAMLASQPQSGLGVAPPVNPRVTSPQTSPSPIPQPASSGGRPPSTYQSQGNGPSFGSFGDAGDVSCGDSYLALFSFPFFLTGSLQLYEHPGD